MSLPMKAKPAVPQSQQLCLLTEAACAAHPSKVAEGGEDAYFISTRGGGAFGVADGVGGWRSRGVNSAEYSQTFMHNVKMFLEAREELLVEGPCQEPMMECDGALHQLRTVPSRNPLGSMMIAHAVTRVAGSTTACVVQLDEQTGTLQAANLGDSGFLVLREGQVLTQSRSLQHSFDCPLQFGYPGLVHSTDWAADADTFSITMQAGDVIVAGTDGLWDNVFVEELATIAHDCRVDLKTAATRLLELAMANAVDRRFQSPYYMKAREEWHRLPWWERLVGTCLGNSAFHPDRSMGGKPDDITIVVSLVCERHPTDATPTDTPVKIVSNTPTIKASPSPLYSTAGNDIVRVCSGSMPSMLESTASGAPTQRGKADTEGHATPLATCASSTLGDGDYYDGCIPQDGHQHGEGGLQASSQPDQGHGSHAHSSLTHRLGRDLRHTLSQANLSRESSSNSVHDYGGCNRPDGNDGLDDRLDTVRLTMSGRSTARAEELEVAAAVASNLPTTVVSRAGQTCGNAPGADRAHDADCAPRCLNYTACSTCTHGCVCACDTGCATSCAHCTAGAHAAEWATGCAQCPGCTCSGAYATDKTSDKAQCHGTIQHEGWSNWQPCGSKGDHSSVLAGAGTREGPDPCASIRRLSSLDALVNKSLRACLEPSHACNLTANNLYYGTSNLNPGAGSVDSCCIDNCCLDNGSVKNRVDIQGNTGDALDAVLRVRAVASSWGHITNPVSAREVHGVKYAKLCTTDDSAASGLTSGMNDPSITLIKAPSAPATTADTAESALGAVSTLSSDMNRSSEAQIPSAPTQGSPPQTACLPSSQLVFATHGIKCKHSMNSMTGKHSTCSSSSKLFKAVAPISSDGDSSNDGRSLGCLCWRQVTRTAVTPAAASMASSCPHGLELQKLADPGTGRLIQAATRSHALRGGREVAGFITVSQLQPLRARGREQGMER